MIIESQRKASELMEYHIFELGGKMYRIFAVQPDGNGEMVIDFYSLKQKQVKLPPMTLRVPKDTEFKIYILTM